jgi:hypothetical protein
LRCTILMSFSDVYVNANCLQTDDSVTMKFIGSRQ